MSTGLADEVVAAARVVAARALVDAFGHASARDGARMLITPGVPLGSVRDAGALVEVPLDVDELPPGAPKEAWAHLAIYRRRPDAGGIVRGQPPAVAALAATGLPLVPLHGQSALLDPPVRTYGDSRLVRDPARADALADALGEGHCLVMRGNGALTVADGPGKAAARLYLLEATADLNLRAAAAGEPRALPAEELAAWRATSAELLGRLWAHLAAL